MFISHTVRSDEAAYRLTAGVVDARNRAEEIGSVRSWLRNSSAAVSIAR